MLRLHFQRRPTPPEPILTAGEIDKHLHTRCLVPHTEWRSQGIKISEKTVRDIQTFLLVLDNRNNRYDDQRWTLRPRIYGILRNIDATECMDNFIRGNLTDFSLPFNEQTLPQFLGERAGKNLRHAFFDIQEYYLTDVKDIESTKSLHLTLSVSGDTYFIPERPLGQGGFGWVFQSPGRLSSC